MASTYVNDLRLNELATGDASGSWGTVTNTNLELIAEAFSYGTEGITTNADTHTTTVADGATDPGRSMFLKYTGTLDSACTITIAPNTISKLWFIENATSGSQNIIISQGSGANITIPPGDTKVVYSDGAGSGAAMVDAFASLSVVDLKVQDDLTVTDDMTVGGTLGVTGVLTGTSLDISGDIDVDGTTNLDIVDIDGAVDMATTALVTGVLTANGGVVFNEGSADVDFRVESNGATNALLVDGGNNHVNIMTSTDLGAVFNVSGNAYIQHADNSDTLTLESTDADANNGPNLMLYRSSANPADGDRISSITYRGRNDNSQDVDYIVYDSFITDASDGVESGELDIRTMVAGTETTRILLDPAETVFNEASADLDFRVESNGNANMLFVDGGNDKIGVNTNSPDAIFTVDTDVGGSSTGTLARFHASKGESDSTYLQIAATRHGTASVQRVQLQAFDDDGSTGRTLALNPSGGSVGVGTNTPSTALEVSGVTTSGGLILTEIALPSAGTPTIFRRDSDGHLYIQSADVSGTDKGIVLLDGGQNTMINAQPATLTFQTGNALRMRIDSNGNVLVGTEAAGGEIANILPVTAGRFRTFAGSQSAANNTATTMVTLPSGFATYIVNLGFNGVNNAGAYGATAIIHTDGSTNSITQLVNPSNMTISMSGMAVQGTQTSGSTLNISFSILRM